MHFTVYINLLRTFEVKNINTSLNISENSNAIFFQDSKKDVIYHPTIESNKELLHIRTKENKKTKRGELPIRPPKSNRLESINNIQNQDNEENKMTIKIPRRKSSINKSEIKDIILNKSVNTIRSEVIMNKDFNSNNILEHRRNSANFLDNKLTISEKYNTKKYNSNVLKSRTMIENIFASETVVKNLSPNLKPNDVNYISISSIDDNDVSRGVNREISPRGSYRSLISNDYSNNV